MRDDVSADDTPQAARGCKTAALDDTTALIFSAVPSITSTDKSVCATLILPDLDKCCYRRECVWHRHSCLCFGKMRKLSWYPDQAS